MARDHVDFVMRRMAVNVVINRSEASKCDRPRHGVLSPSYRSRLPGPQVDPDIDSPARIRLHLIG